MPVCVNWLVFTIIPDASPFFVRPFLRMILSFLMNVWVYPRLRANIAMLEAHLAKRPGKFIAGGDEPTEADFLIIFPFEQLCTKPDESGVGEHIKAYVDMVHERPAYKRGLEKGGPYDLRFT
ncbi:hypothetical protein FS749_004928 [Ceratobasidium sp. UAMH 11750]|nr:hypothetical protein FS749_004928 [Ceratobasidium sp. UAMH 11750]